MRDAFMLIGIRTTLTDFHVFQVTSHIVGIFELGSLRYQFTCCQCTKLIHFQPVREFLVEVHTAKMDV